uniref:ATP-dependent DNA helicase n=1 Tax=Globodera rostochiensis TaxID=31243 RepID=A0A914GRB9_GLORO
MLRRAHGLLIDEISMQHKDVIEYVDKVLRAVAPTSLLKRTPFGGKVVVLGGDWKQLAPVIPGGGHLDQLNASVKFSNVFRHFTTRRLRANHRLQAGQENYRRFLLRVGTAQSNNGQHRVRLSAEMCVASRHELIDFVFSSAMLSRPLEHANEFGGCAILSPLNKETFELNKIILDRIVGLERVYSATTQPLNDGAGNNELANAVADADYENLQRFTPSGVPEYFLRIKIGAIMMLITNVSIADGLCNGTRVQVLPGPNGTLTNHIIRCRLLSGNKRGNEHDLHATRFVFGGDPIAPHEGPIKFERVQFPLRPGSVMTINKSQGQTLSRVGLLLDNAQCFSHGQLYVALSRVQNASHIRVCTKSNKQSIKNIVMQELLDDTDLQTATEAAAQSTPLQSEDESAAEEEAAPTSQQLYATPLTASISKKYPSYEATLFGRMSL